MAATATNLTSGFSASSPGTTASIAPAASRVLLVAVAAAKTGSPAPAAGTVAISGLGLTWQEVQDPGGAALTQEYRSRRRLFWFVAETGGSAPTPGTLAVTYSGAATLAGLGWSVDELAGVVLGNGGQDAIGNIGNLQVGTGSTSISVTVTDTPVAGDISMGMAGIEQAGGTPGATSPATAVELSNNEHADIRHLIVAYDPDAAMAFTFGPWGSTSNGAGAMALRVIASAGGPATAALAPGTLTLTAQAVNPQPGPVTVSLVPAELALAAQPLTPQAIGSTVQLAAATLPLAGQPVTPAPGAVATALAPAELAVAAQPVSPQAGAGLVLLAPATATLQAQQLDAQPGVVAVDLAPATLTLTARPLLQPAAGPVDITVVVGPTRLRQLATVGGTRGGWAVGETRDGWAVGATRSQREE